MVGAAHLSGVADGVVVDLGGNITNVGRVAGGLPQACAGRVEVAGIPANIGVPDLASIRLGNDSRVVEGKEEDAFSFAFNPRTGSQSQDHVSSETVREAVAAAGLSESLSNGVGLGKRAQAMKVLARVREMVEDAVDRAKVTLSNHYSKQEYL